MVISLKELSIRGDFRTTVEYLIKLLETDAFESNKITTGWLDGSSRTASPPSVPPPTSPSSAARAVKAHLLARECEDEYKRILNKGQVPPRDTIKTVFSIDFIYENVKYNFTATRSSVSSWVLYLNGAHAGAAPSPHRRRSAHRSFRKSHPVYWREEVGMTRLMVDSKTCLIEQENDPTQIRSPSPGKLVRFLVDSGDHVKSGQAIAEIEVMKMYLPLVAAEDGVVSFVKTAGVALSPVTSSVSSRSTTPAVCSTPSPSPVSCLTSACRSSSATSPTSATRTSSRCSTTSSTVTTRASACRSSSRSSSRRSATPELPYGQASQILSSLGGRIPSRLEDVVRNTIEMGHSKHIEFPAARLRKLTENFLRDSVDPAIRNQVQITIAPLCQLFDEYAAGSRPTRATCSPLSSRGITRSSPSLLARPTWCSSSVCRPMATWTRSSPSRLRATASTARTPCCSP